jgi:hypothetical protein
LSVEQNLEEDGGAAAMQAKCTGEALIFQGVSGREVVARFDGGQQSSDVGGLLLNRVEKRRSILGQFTRCFRDGRDAARIEHTVEELISQRVMALALGYEDLNDHEQLRHDPLLALLSGRGDVTRPLAGKSTLNRLELGGTSGEDRYKKIVVDPERIDRFFVDVFLQSQHEPERIVLDMDTTDTVLHGNQEGRHYLSHYGEYCYLPLYIVSGDHLLCARLRPASVDAAEGVVGELDRIFKQIRQSWKNVQIVVRADSGFCRDEIMSWCEDNGVDFVIGLQKNSRLDAEIAAELWEAKLECERTGKAVRKFKEFEYQTLRSWSRPRRVVAKAEHLVDKANPRFVVTSFRSSNAQTVYEVDYSGRGEMENRIKEQKCFLFADRMSAETMHANQLRLWFSAVAYLLISALRRDALQNTELAHAQCDTIRLRLFKIGGRIRVTTRRIWISLASSYPWIDLFRQITFNMANASP